VERQVAGEAIVVVQSQGENIVYNRRSEEVVLHSVEGVKNLQKPI
jgi:hypothetical protein